VREWRCGVVESIVTFDDGLRAPVRRIDFDGADLYIRADGDWRGFRSRPCAKEPETAQWLRETAAPGVVIFDIGACVGSYSLIAAALGAAVHAFEPMALNYAHLQRNIWLNRLENITAWPVALSAQTGPVELALSTPIAGAASHRLLERASPPSPAGRELEGGLSLSFVPTAVEGPGAMGMGALSSPPSRGRVRERGKVGRQSDVTRQTEKTGPESQVSPSPHPSPIKGEGANSPPSPAGRELEGGLSAILSLSKDGPLTHPVLAFALDELAARFNLPRPDHIKIDVDGNEVLVLEGARETLRHARTVMVEADRATEAAVTAILTAAGLTHEASWPRSGAQRNHLFRR
jgi:hypothetical protein